MPREGPHAPRGATPGQREAPDWPADLDAIERARDFLRSCSGTVAIACDNDVDGLCAAVIAERALAGGVARVRTLPARRGEHVHQDGMRDRIRATGPRALVALDMGSRPGAILPGVPTLVIDHHNPERGVPPDAIVVNSFDRELVAPTSVLAYVVCRALAQDETIGWLATLGAVADLGTAGPFAKRLGIPTGGAAWARAASLLNAARRAPDPDPRAALEVLRATGDVCDLLAGSVPGVDRLESFRQQVREEMDRVSHVPPLTVGHAAVIEFSSRAQVHPVVATRWARRLDPLVVIAANAEFLPGRVNFAIRSHRPLDLLGWLRSLPFTAADDAEYANGHARATGGSLNPADFERFLAAVLEAPYPTARDAELAHGGRLAPGARLRTRRRAQDGQRPAVPYEAAPCRKADAYAETSGHAL
jgi:single-stranded-DNA-specific exonuclease